MLEGLQEGLLLQEVFQCSEANESWHGIVAKILSCELQLPWFKSCLCLDLNRWPKASHSQP